MVASASLPLLLITPSLACCVDRYYIVVSLGSCEIGSISITGDNTLLGETPCKFLPLKRIIPSVHKSRKKFVYHTM